MGTQVKKASKFGAKKTTSFATKSAVPKKKAGLSTQKIDDDFDDFDDWDVDVEEEEPAEDLTVESVSQNFSSRLSVQDDKPKPVVQASKPKKKKDDDDWDSFELASTSNFVDTSYSSRKMGGTPGQPLKQQGKVTSISSDQYLEEMRKRGDKIHNNTQEN